MELKYQEANEPATVVRTPFGFADNKGRATGYVCTIQPIDVTEGGDGHWCRQSITGPGRWFRLYGSPTRAGNAFGPSFNSSYWPTFDAAWNEATRLAEQCRKSYAKKFVLQPRCQDCGAVGKRTGHQDCQYPDNH